MTITATEFKTNLGKYIDFIATHDENITVTKNGKNVLRISKPDLSAAERLASLIEPQKKKWNYDSLKKEALEEKYEIAL